MHHKRQIQVLTAKGKWVDFPHYRRDFEMYKSLLREVIKENFGPLTYKTLDYDRDSQCFWLTLKVDGLMTHSLKDEWPSRDRIGMTLTFQARIDPRQDLLPQLQAIEEQHEHMKDRHHLLQALLWKYETQKEQDKTS